MSSSSGETKSTKARRRITLSRCCMKRMITVLEGARLAADVKDALSNSPFGRMLEGQAVALDTPALEYLIPRWDPIRKGFFFNGHFVEFTVMDIQAILGLSAEGELVQFEGEPTGRFYLENFAQGPITRAVLEKKLYVAARDNDESVVQFCLLYIFCSFLFTASNYSLDAIFVQYVGALDRLSQFNWAEAVHRYLCESLTRCSGKLCSITGCAIVLPVWLYEHCTLFDDQKVHGVYPRIFRWCNVKSIRFNTLLRKLNQLSPDKIIFQIQFDDMEVDREIRADVHISEAHSSTPDSPVHTPLEEDEAHTPIYTPVHTPVHTPVQTEVKLVDIEVLYEKDKDNEDDSVYIHEINRLTLELENCKQQLENEIAEKAELEKCKQQLQNEINRLTLELEKCKQQLQNEIAEKASLMVILEDQNNLIADLEQERQLKKDFEVATKLEIDQLSATIKELEQKIKQGEIEKPSKPEDFDWSSSGEGDNKAKSAPAPATATATAQRKRLRKKSSLISTPYTEGKKKSKPSEVNIVQFLPYPIEWEMVDE